MTAAANTGSGSAPGPDTDDSVSGDAAIDSAAGWVVTGATFLATFTVFGVAYSFGSFFGPMAEEFGSDRSATALFFAITTFCYFALGVVTGHIADRRGPRPVLLTGAVFLVVGLFATSRVTSIWAGYATYGLGVGVGVACAYVPMVATVGGWFERRRTTALGLAVAGIGAGTLIVAPLSERLIESHGWRRSYVILAIGAAVLLSVAALGAKRPPSAAGAMPGRSLATLARSSRDFWALYLSIGLLSVTLFVPFVFLPDFVDTRGVDGSAGWLNGLLGIASVLGRLGLGALAARLSSMALCRGSYLVLSLSFLIWLAAGSSYLLLVVFVVVAGVAYGGFIALSPAVAAERFGPVGLGAVLGALYTAAGVGGLVGPPLMGRIIDGPGYATAQLVAMVVGLAATATTFLIAGDEA